MKTIQRIVIALTLFSVTACSSQSRLAKAPVEPGRECYTEATHERSVRLDLIRQLVVDGQYFSALAHLEQEPFTSPGSHFLRAESLRKSGQPEAALKEYHGLKRGCLAALGYLGTGKVLAIRGELDKAMSELKTARDMLPTDANIRNDYGFALLAAGRFQEAESEFVTAVQLNNGHQVAVRNLVLSLMLSQDLKTAWAVAEHHNITTEDFQDLVIRADQFRRELRRPANGQVADIPRQQFDQPILVRTGDTL